MSPLRQRLDVAFIVAWEAPWHVGSGMGAPAVDRTLRRRTSGPRHEGAPYVPGSQIKGVLRHHCERLAALLGAEVVSPHVVSRERPAELLKNFRALDASALLIDRLFGTRFQGDCLFVEDAVAQSDPAARPRLHSRTSIDRLTGGARDQTLFVTEVAPRESAALRGSLHARHPAGALTQVEEDAFPLEYSLLIAGLLSLDALGGGKSAGLGRCRIEVDNEAVRWNDVGAFSLGDALKSFEDLGEDWLPWLEDLRKEGAP